MKEGNAGIIDKRRGLRSLLAILEVESRSGDYGDACSYGRVCRKKFRQRLLEKCKEQGVQFLAGEVANISCQDGAAASEVTLVDGLQLKTRSPSQSPGCSVCFKYGNKQQAHHVPT
jgi:hypothetical protein